MIPSVRKKHEYGKGMAGCTGRGRRRLIRDSIQGVSKYSTHPQSRRTPAKYSPAKSSIRKMARRGGVTRIEQTVYTTTRDILQHKLREILAVAIQYVEHRNAKTVTSLDIVYALRHIPGISRVYGYSFNPPIITESKPKALIKPVRRASPPLNELSAMAPPNSPSSAMKAESTTQTLDAPPSPEETGYYTTARILAWAIEVSQVGITNRHILEDLSFFYMSSSSSSSEV